MKAFATIVIGVVLLAVALAMFAPATLVDSRVARATDGRLRVADAHGTVWHGRGTLAMADALRVPIEWRLDPWALLRGDASVTLLSTQTGHGVAGRLQADAARVQVDSLVVRGPAAIVTALPAASTMRAGGDITLRSDAFSRTQAGAEGRVSGEWRNARVLVPGMPLVSLGTVNADVAANGGVLSGPVTARGGDLTVDGTVTIDAATLAAKLRLQPQAGAPAALRDVLGRLGPVDASGTVQVQFQQPLR